MLVSYLHILSICYISFSYFPSNAMTDGPKNNHGTYNRKYPDFMLESKENNVVDRLVKRKLPEIKKKHAQTPKVPSHLPNVANNHAKHLTASHNNCEDNRSKILNCVKQEHLSYGTRNCRGRVVEQNKTTDIH